MIPTLFGAAVLVFLLMRAHPRRHLRAAAGHRRRQHRSAGRCATAAPRSAPTSRWSCSSCGFIKGLVTFDFGKSMWTGRPIIEEIGLRFQLSLQVAIMATHHRRSCSPSRSAPSRPSSRTPGSTTWCAAFSIAGVAMPSFWLGILIILGILITSKAWFGTPWMPPITYVPIWVDPLHNLSMLIWPALATGYRYSAVATRMTRSAMLEVLREDYVRTARAKGVFQQADRAPARAAQRAAAGRHHHRHRVRLPDGRPGRHRAGVQPQRARQAVRRVGARTTTTT